MIQVLKKNDRNFNQIMQTANLLFPHLENKSGQASFQWAPAHSTRGSDDHAVSYPRLCRALESSLVWLSSLQL